MVAQTSCLCSFLCVQWQRLKAFVSTGVLCLWHELGPFAHIHMRSHSHVLGCSLTHTSTPHKSMSGLQSHFREHSGFLSLSSSEMLTAEGLGGCSTGSSPFRSWWQERESQATGEVVHRHFRSTPSPSCWPVWVCRWCHMEETLLLSVIVIHCFKSLHSESHSTLLWCASPCPQLISTWWPSPLPVCPFA